MSGRGPKRGFEDLGWDMKNTTADDKGKRQKVVWVWEVTPLIISIISGSILIE